MVVKRAVGKVAYALAFNVALPALLILWARGAIVAAPAVVEPTAGWCLVGVGLDRKSVV